MRICVIVFTKVAKQGKQDGKKFLKKILWATGGGHFVKYWECDLGCHHIQLIFII